MRVTRPSVLSTLSDVRSFTASIRFGMLDGLPYQSPPSYCSRAMARRGPVWAAPTTASATSAARSDRAVLMLRERVDKQDCATHRHLERERGATPAPGARGRGGGGRRS